MSTLLLVGLIFSAEEFSLAKPQPSRAHLYADPNVRRIEVDSFIDQFPTSSPIADDVLRRIDPSDLLISSTGAADVNLNPEPSSLLIWEFHHSVFRRVPLLSVDDVLTKRHNLPAESIGNTASRRRSSAR